MEDIINQNKKVYNRIAKPFAETRRLLWDDLKPLAKYTKNGDKVLDIGCGNGRLYQLFSDLSIDYVGLDNSNGQIKMARKNYPAAKFMIGEMTELPFADSIFSVIYCIATFHHLPAEELRLQSLREMKRLLKPYGKIVMTNWNLHNDWVKAKIDEGKFEINLEDSRHTKIPWRTGDGKIWGWRNYWSFTVDELKDLFETAGFEIEEQYFTADKTGRTDIEKGMNIVTVAIVQ